MTLYESQYLLTFMHRSNLTHISEIVCGHFHSMNINWQHISSSISFFAVFRSPVSDSKSAFYPQPLVFQMPKKLTWHPQTKTRWEHFVSSKQWEESHHYSAIISNISDTTGRPIGNHNSI